MYTMEMMPNNTFFIKVIGFIREEEAASYTSDYQLNVNKINASTYKLVIDGTEQVPVPPAVVDDLKKILRLYMTSNFKKIVIVVPTKSVARMQVRRAMDEVAFTGVLVDTLEEAMQL